MCGIYGFLERKSSFDSLVSESAEFINKRGPDGTGKWKQEFSDYSISLLHTRLSIIDLSSNGSQPMQSGDGTWVIIFNGEIYNFVEIRCELSSLGWHFSSASDTEVLVNAWAQWGVEALSKLNGMFAFAAYNKKTGELWLVRDRFGVKPLFWGHDIGKSFVFSSSLGAVARAFNSSVNIDHCSDSLRYKVYEGVSTDSCFCGISSLGPGCWLKVNIDGNPNIHELHFEHGRWYSLKEGVTLRRLELESYKDDDLLSACHALLVDAVNIRLRSDVPITVSLSGGLDSSTVAAIAANEIPEIHGFTYGSPTAKKSEGPVVEKFAKQVGILGNYIWPKFDKTQLNNLLERTFISQEAPCPSLSVLAQNEVFRTVNQAGFKVLLGGQGGDEIFGGYRKFFLVAARNAISKKDVMRSLRLLYSLGLMLFSEVSQAKLYLDSMHRYRPKHDQSFGILDWNSRDLNLWGSKHGTLTDRQIEDVEKWSIPSLLRYEDRNSMAYGVESRLPFMDYRLVEFALALPERLKIANGFGKWALRKITSGTVPSYIRLERKKRGFDVTQSWIEDGLGDVLRERIYEHRGKLQPFLRRDLMIDKVLSDSALLKNSNLLDEALMLAWLAEPIRRPDPLLNTKV